MGGEGRTQIEYCGLLGHVANHSCAFPACCHRTVYLQADNLNLLWLILLLLQSSLQSCQHLSQGFLSCCPAIGGRDDHSSSGSSGRHAACGPCAELVGSRLGSRPHSAFSNNNGTESQNGDGFGGCGLPLNQPREMPAAKVAMQARQKIAYFGEDVTLCTECSVPSTKT